MYNILEHKNLTKEIFLTENKLNDDKISEIFNNFDLSNTFVYICGTINYNSMIGDIAKQKRFVFTRIVSTRLKRICFSLNKNVLLRQYIINYIF